MKIVISASRRTDIPAFYMDDFMAQIHAGSFRVENPYNRKVSIVPASSDAVHTIVFWSKNFGPFLNGGYGQALKDAGYNLFFNFTVNAPDPLLEPGVPPLAQRLDQLDGLCRITDPRAVTWRFDPICFYQMDGGVVKSNLEAFGDIARRAAAVGVRRCVTSFMDPYAKVRKRASAIRGFAFADIPLDGKAAILTRLAGNLEGTGISLKACCEKAVLSALPEGSRISGSACIPNDLLVELFGGRLSLRRDSGQRVKQGCGCRVAVDVGSYRHHPCYHNCLFCYANPVSPEGAQRDAHRTDNT